MSSNNRDETVAYLKREKNLGGKPAFDSSAPVNLIVKIRRDDSVTPANFKPDPLIPGGYLANGLTIEAMRKDIFSGGDDVDILLMEYSCPSCNHSIDLQFWIKCPYCGREIDKSFAKKIDSRIIKS